ncbi:hypothetical protein QYG06_17860 [Xanthomonas euvesicatoria]|nr:MULTISPECIES: hypothetical protein [Xanthomonas]MEB1432054.1 hypothetical protein [Xanthomonas campestris pv. campestris]MEB1997422.1 hypothetical protein [Xanthomonas campestris pv. campestris]
MFVTGAVCGVTAIYLMASGKQAGPMVLALGFAANILLVVSMVELHFVPDVD